MTDHYGNRRRFLEALGAVGVGGAAGCLGGGDDATSTRDGATETPTGSPTDPTGTAPSGGTGTPTSTPPTGKPPTETGTPPGDDDRPAIHAIGEREPADFADPLVGNTDSRWMLYPGPSRPFGMVKLSPDNQLADPIDGGGMWKAGYEYTNDRIDGFSHLHSWTVGGLLTMPTAGTTGITPVGRSGGGGPLSPTTELTAAVWLKSSETDPGLASVLRHNGHATPLQFTSGGGARAVWFPAGSDGFEELPVDPGPLLDGEWHHYAFRYEAGSEAAVFVDGEQVAAATSNVGELAATTNDWGLGFAVDYEQDEQFLGCLDEFRLYDAALSDADVSSLAATEPSEPGSPVVAYAFDQSGVDDVTDEAEGDHPGQVSGDPGWVDGVSGQAISFDDAGDHVSIAASADVGGYASAISHETESASPGYYSVNLDDYGIRAELTSTTRAGFQRYTFPESEDARILFDLLSSYEYEKEIPDATVERVSDTEIEGYARMEGPAWQGTTQEYTLYTVGQKY